MASNSIDNVFRMVSVIGAIMYLRSRTSPMTLEERAKWIMCRWDKTFRMLAEAERAERGET